MRASAAVTIGRPREEVMRLWQSSEHRATYVDDAGAAVSFVDAPGDRGTEIHVDLGEEARGGRLGEVIGKLTGNDPLAQVKDDLRRFKQFVETGEIARSDATPEGESASRKLKQRPAQPLEASERQEILR
jgi:uncharacterized membrane protein